MGHHSLCQDMVGNISVEESWERNSVGLQEVCVELRGGRSLLRHLMGMDVFLTSLMLVSS